MTYLNTNEPLINNKSAITKFCRNNVQSVIILTDEVSNKPLYEYNEILVNVI